MNQTKEGMASRATCRIIMDYIQFHKSYKSLLVGMVQCLGSHIFHPLIGGFKDVHLWGFIHEVKEKLPHD